MGCYTYQTENEKNSTRILNEEMEHLEKLLGVIEPSASEWASPSVLVRKRDDSVRWCIDVRKLNGVTVNDCFPLPW